MNCWIARLIWCWWRPSKAGQRSALQAGGDDAFDRGFMARHCVHVWKGNTTALNFADLQHYQHLLFAVDKEQRTGQAAGSCRGLNVR